MTDSAWYQTFDTALKVAGLSFDLIGWHLRPHSGRAITNTALIERVSATLAQPS